MCWKVFSVATAALLFATPGFGQDPLADGILETVATHAEFLEEVGSQLVLWSEKFEKPGSQYIRLHFSNAEGPEDGTAVVLIKDRSGHILEQIPQSELVRSGERWSEVVFGGYAGVEVVANAQPVGFSFDIDQIAYEKPGAVPFSIVLPDDREPIVNYQSVPEIAARERSVAKLFFVTDRGPAVCSGFLVKTELMLTNFHCIAKAAVCDSAVSIFGYQFNDQGVLNPGTQYKCEEILDLDQTLDFSLLRISGDPGLVWGTLELTDRQPVADEQAFLIQHPGGEPKQISRKGCNIVSSGVEGNGPNTDLGHQCDTMGGSSGSPLLGQDFKVIGLHHFGFGSGVWSNTNRAVWMKLVLERIGSQLGN